MKWTSFLEEKTQWPIVLYSYFVSFADEKFLSMNIIVCMEIHMNVTNF